MTPHPSVLLGLRDSDLGDRLGGWVRDRGFRTCFTDDAREAIDRLRNESFTASFLDSEMGCPEGQAVWRLLQPVLARRVVLMARDRRRELLFEALGFGVATVLPLPPVEAMVSAALSAVSGPPSGRARWRSPDTPNP